MSKWWQTTLGAGLIITVVGHAIIVGSNLYAQHKQKDAVVKVQLVAPDNDNKAHIEPIKKVDKFQKLPITVTDGKGNYLHLGIPIGHETYYEFPITLIDDGNSSRIDKYDWLNKYSGKLIFIEKPE